MSVIVAIVTAFSCFSAIPMPNLPWDERNMRHMMAAFPLVGAVIGLADLAWWLVAQRLGLGPVCRDIHATSERLYIPSIRQKTEHFCMMLLMMNEQFKDA